MSREQIRQAALVMDPDERVALAVELFESLEPEALLRVTIAAEEQTLAAEANRRLTLRLATCSRESFRRAGV